MMVVINSLNYDRSVKRRWNCELIEIAENALVLEGRFDKDIEHSELGLIRKGTVSREYYWLDRWYNVFEFSEPDGPLRNFYCNINMPPTFAENRLEYIDLDVDLVVWPDLSIQMLDMDEFEASAKAHRFPPDVRPNVQRAIDELLSMITRRQAPFNVLGTR